MNSLFLNIRTYRNKALSLALLLSIVVELFVPFYSAEASTTASTPEVITFTNVGNASWTVPEDVTSIKVKVWGAGGAGGSGEKINESNRSGLGGGAGGYVEKTLSVTPGDSYSITVGAGGQGIMSYIDGRVGNPGTDSRFEGSGVTLVAAGGRGGASYTGEANPIEPIGTGGSASGGDVNETGGNGGSYTEVDDNPYATSGGSAYNGGNGGSRGRCGRDGACPGSEIGSLLAQDGGFPGGGGGGSDVAEGGYGAHGLVTIEIPVPTVINEPPIGYLDTVSCTALQGWAYDPSSPSTVVGIHFYTEDALGNLVFIGDTAANVARADVNQNAGISGDHAFNFPLPTSLKNGLIHKIYAYALDSTDANLNTLLSNSPMSVGGCTNSSTGGNTGGNTGNAGNITANITSNVGVCSVAGTPMVFTVVVSGSGVTSVVLEKDTNNDGVWGVATSWTTAGSHTYTSNEAANYTGTYKLRLLVNGSVVASREVNVQANCGGNSTGNNNGSGNNGGNQITASITTTAPGCVPVGTNIPFMINVSGSGVTSVVLEKDTNNDGVFGPAASWSSGGNQSFASSESAAYTGVYSLRLIVNGTIYDTRTVTVAASCTSTNFTVTPLTGLTTTEAGGQAVFTVVLNAAPLSNVTLPINSSNHNEGTTTPITFLTFTPANWNVSQAVTITGRDDSAVDGNVNYSVIVGPSVSSDMNANGMAAQSVFVTNNDNEAPTTSGGSSTGGSSSGGRGGGGGGRSNLRCTGFGCPTTSATTTTSTSSNNLGDIVILLDQPPTYTAPAVTGPELVCPSVNFITTFLKVGVDNNPNEVRKLQYFLNTYEGANLVIDGIFDTNTENAVKALQSKYTNEILSPWGVSTPTGIVYITTTNHINKVYCNDNPGYTGNESISDIIDNTVLYPEVDNSAEFEGEIGMATSTDDGSNSNLAGVGSISSRIWDGLKDIPLYLILILALMFTGAGIILSNVLKKDIPAHAVYVSLIKGSAVLAIGSVLNVLNIVSYILNPEWFMERSGFTLGWLLALNAINLGLIIAICLAVLISLYGRLARVRS